MLSKDLRDKAGTLYRHWQHHILIWSVSSYRTQNVGSYPFWDLLKVKAIWGSFFAAMPKQTREFDA